MKTYTGVHSDFVQKQYISLSHAKKAGCIYALGDKNDGNRPLLDLDGNRIPFIEAGGWKAHDPVETVRSSANYKTWIRFEDPHGEVQSVSFAKPMPLSRLFSTLQDMSSYNFLE